MQYMSIPHSTIARVAKLSPAVAVYRRMTDGSYLVYLADGSKARVTKYPSARRPGRTAIKVEFNYGGEYV